MDAHPEWVDVAANVVAANVDSVWDLDVDASAVDVIADIEIFPTTDISLRIYC